MTSIARLAAALLVLAAATTTGAQGPTTELTISGCLQRAPSSVADKGRFMLMNAGPSPLGGKAATTGAAPEPSRTDESVQHRRGEPDARQETGGVMYLLEGRSDLESKVGRRVEVTGTLGPQVDVPPFRPTLARPMRQVRVKQVRSIAPGC